MGAFFTFDWVVSESCRFFAFGAGLLCIIDGINQFGALAMFLTYVAGVVYLVTGNPGIFHGDGMDVILVCLFTLGISIWTLVRGAGFLFSGGLSSGLDFPALVDLYQFPGTLLGMWTS